MVSLFFMVEVTGVFKKQEFYETVLLKLYKKIKDTLMDVFYYLVEVTGRF